MQMILPSVVIGAGHNAVTATSRIAERFALDALIIRSNQHKCSYDKDVSPSIEHIRLNSDRILNPSHQIVRGLLFKEMPSIKGKVSNYNTVLLIGDLAEKDGIAVLPMLAEILAGINKRIISVVAMPFSFEKSILFRSSIALRLIKAKSRCMVIIDRDALLDIAPEVSVDDSNAIISDTILEVVNAMLSREDVEDCDSVYVPTRSHLCSNDADTHVKELLKQFYSSCIEEKEVRRVLIHVIGSELSIGNINSMVKHLSVLLECKIGVDVSILYVDNNARSGVMTLYEVKGTRFDAYDPLHGIVGDRVLDFSCEYGKGVLEELWLEEFNIMDIDS